MRNKQSLAARPGKKPHIEKQRDGRSLFDSAPKTDNSITERVEKTFSGEIIVALCGPMGSPLHRVARKIQSEVTTKFGYTAKTIQLSDYIRKHGDVKAKGLNTYEERRSLIAEGDRLRGQYGPEVLAELAIHEIGTDRVVQQQASKESRHTPRRNCYIIDSIKNPAELGIFRKVYGDLFYCVGVSGALKYRIESLTDLGFTTTELAELMDLDSGEEIGHGQSVRETFPLADFFLKVDSWQDNEIAVQVDRFLSAVFGNTILTPTLHERAMHYASSAANNSACLSRQVGAAITDRNGKLLGVGWNDVPKFGGGLYTSENNAAGTDHRCMAIKDGICNNDFQKGVLAERIANDLVMASVINSSQKDQAKFVILKSKIRDLIEFSRSVHAEMHAIINASQASGNQMMGGRLYCTTYPCHACARHIVAAGLSEVHYIEPYRKSLATDLHRDAITEDENESDKVRLLAFEGVAPRKFDDFFKAKPNSRKMDGKMALNHAINAEPLIKESLEAIPKLEAFITNDLVQKKLIEEPGSDADEETKQQPEPDILSIPNVGDRA